MFSSHFLRPTPLPLRVAALRYEARTKSRPPSEEPSFQWKGTPSGIFDPDTSCWARGSISPFIVHPITNPFEDSDSDDSLPELDSDDSSASSSSSEEDAESLESELEPETNADIVQTLVIPDDLDYQRKLAARRKRRSTPVQSISTPAPAPNDLVIISSALIHFYRTLQSNAIISAAAAAADDDSHTIPPALEALCDDNCDWKICLRATALSDNLRPTTLNATPIARMIAQSLSSSSSSHHHHHHHADVDDPENESSYYGPGDWTTFGTLHSIQQLEWIRYIWQSRFMRVYADGDATKLSPKESHVTKQILAMVPDEYPESTTYVYMQWTAWTYDASSAAAATTTDGHLAHAGKIPF